MNALVYVSPERGAAWCAAMLRHCKLQPDEARIVADTMISANLRGVDTHGLIMLLHYMRRFTQIPTREIRVMQETCAGVSIDGGDNMGMLVSNYAVDRAVEKARQYGVGIATVRNSNHFGACAYYALKAAHQGMVGIAMTNAGPRIAPWGGMEAFVGNNPVAAAMPGVEFPIVLDMANSVVAFQRISVYAREGKPLPDGWAMDARGNPTNDAQAAMSGTLYPLGGYKGVGMAIMVDLLTGILSRNGCGDVVEDIAAHSKARHNGHLFIAIDIHSFIGWEEYNLLMQNYVRRFHGIPKAHGVDRLYLPGELEAEREAERRLTGLPFTGKQLEQLNALAAEFGEEALA